MEDILVTVIVPVYNVEKYVSECVESILNQTYRNIEIILIDDGSKDQSGKICDSFAEKDARVKVIHKENGGVGSARNAGLDIAGGDYIAFLDGDDCYADDAIKYLIDAITASGCKLAIGKEQVFLDGNSYAEEDIELEERLISEYEFWMLRNKNARCVISSTKIYAKSLWDGVRFNNYKNHEDQAVLWEIISKCDEIFYSNKTIIFYRTREGSAVNSEFSLDKMFLVSALIPEMDYFMERGNVELLTISFGMGTRVMLEGMERLTLRDEDVKDYVTNQYKAYKKYAKYILLNSKSMVQKIRMLLFVVNIKLYACVKKIFR